LAAIHPNDSSFSLTQQQYYEQIANVRPVFGMPLAEAVECCAPRLSDVCLPAVVYRCLEYLVAKGASKEEGIFRLSGSSLVIKGLRDRFNLEGDLDFLADDQYYDVHAVASLLKLYLRELPTSVLTRELHLDFLAVLSDCDDKPKKVAAYKVLVRKLPKANWTLIRALSAFLIGIISNSEVNKMSIRNVGIVFAPTLNIPAPVFALFLTDFESIFAEEYDDSAVPAVEISVTEPLTPEDIRSPRRQMFSELPTPSYNQLSFPSAENPNENSRPAPGPAHDTGFTPLQPSYEPPSSSFPNHIQFQSESTMGGPDYGVISRKPGVNNVKARRRESSMLLMGNAQRKSSMPGLRGDTVREESAINS
jgi:RalA-binding protein 1